MRIIVNAKDAKGEKISFEYKSKLAPNVGDEFNWESDDYSEHIEYGIVIKRKIGEYLSRGERKTQLTIYVISDDF